VACCSKRYGGCSSNNALRLMPSAYKIPKAPSYGKRTEDCTVCPEPPFEGVSSHPNRTVELHSRHEILDRFWEIHREYTGSLQSDFWTVSGYQTMIFLLVQHGSTSPSMPLRHWKEKTGFVNQTKMRNHDFGEGLPFPFTMSLSRRKIHLTM
jgi:hypothetical protein